MIRKKIIFFSHAVTMAHFTRPLSWIENLDQSQYDIYLATSCAFKKLCPAGVTFLKATCIDSFAFAKSVNKGGLIYDKKTFESHVSEDLRILDQIGPDLVIGDFRHSLSVSCRLKKIKYINLTNAYWEPDTRMPYPMPEIPIVRLLGERLANLLVKPFLPLALKINFFKMVFEIRKSLKTANLHFSDYRQIITDGDITVYADTPMLVPLKSYQPNKKYIGPLIWSSSAPQPVWWPKLKMNRKHIFLSLGSSGDARLLPMIINALARMDVEIIVALAGQKVDLPSYTNVYCADYLPLTEVLRNASIVICNGGSPMSHAALACGTPVLGIIFNNDQLLNMSHVQNRNAGLMLRYWNLSENKIKEAVQIIFNEKKYRAAAQTIKKEFDNFDVHNKLRNIIEDNLKSERK